MSSPPAANALLNDKEHMSHTRWLNLSCKVFPVSSRKMNGHVFIYSGVKLLLYLADRCGLMHSPRSHFLSLCKALASMSSSVSPRCSGFIVAPLVITKDLLGCLWAGMCSNMATNGPDGCAQMALTQQWSCCLLFAGSPKSAKELRFFFFFFPLTVKMIEVTA